METPTPKYADDRVALTEQVYDGLIQLLAEGGGPEAIIAYRSPDTVQDRSYELARIKKEGTLTSAEARELEAYLQREHVVRMAKIRARLLLGQNGTPM